MSGIRANREYWNRFSAGYQREHDPQIGAAPRLWGSFSVADSDLGALGDVAGRRVLELGCGAGQWSRALAAEGAAIVGFDLSDEQLRAARAAMATIPVTATGPAAGMAAETAGTAAEAAGAAAGTAIGTARFPLVQGAAEQLPFAAASFDLVFCDHGGLSWAPPELVVPEAARVLRRSGRLVFNISSPWLLACYDESTDRITGSLRQDYFGQAAVAEGDGASTYSLTYGGWIRTLRAAGLVVDDLIEPRPTPGMRNGYFCFEPRGWASRWPCESLWVARKPR